MKELGSTNETTLNESREAPTPEEEKEVDRILRKERSHLAQFGKHFFAFIMVGALLLTNFARGTRKTASLFGIKRCSDEDW